VAVGLRLDLQPEAMKAASLVPPTGWPLASSPCQLPSSVHSYTMRPALWLGGSGFCFVVTNLCWVPGLMQMAQMASSTGAEAGGGPGTALPPPHPSSLQHGGRLHLGAQHNSMPTQETEQGELPGRPLWHIYGWLCWAGLGSCAGTGLFRCWGAVAAVASEAGGPKAQGPMGGGIEAAGSRAAKACSPWR
jgi:hypothetical protein